MPKLLLSSFIHGVFLYTSPKFYREEVRERILDFLRANNFPALVTYDGEKSTATHRPVDVIEGEDGAFTILGHMSRANPQWKSFGEHEVLTD